MTDKNRNTDVKLLLTDRTPTGTLLLTTMLVLISHALYAHHSFSAEFLADKTLTIEGTVTEVWFKNPHVRYYVNVVQDDGDEVMWDVRTSSPALLVRRGWHRDTINEGDVVKIEGFAGRDERKILSLISVELEDGTVLGHSY